MDISRRELLLATVMGMAVLALPGCSGREPLLRIGTSVWPGYAFLQYAYRHGELSRQHCKLAILNAPSSIIRALQTGALDGACMTLDDALTVVDSGVPLTIVGLFDASDGADQVLGQPQFASLQDLKGRRIGVEEGALGAVVLAAALQAAGMQAADIRKVNLPLDQQLAAFRAGSIDAVVSFEPVVSELLAAGARTLFSSTQMPGLIVDVLALRSDRIALFPRALAAVLAAHFRHLPQLGQPTGEVMADIARQMGVTPAEAPALFRGIRMLDLPENQRRLAAPAQGMIDLCQRLAALMQQAGLLPGGYVAYPAFSAAYLPEPAP